jgi:hypothetical protein
VCGARGCGAMMCKNEQRKALAGRRRGRRREPQRASALLSLIAKTQIRTVERLREDEAKIKFVPSSAAVTLVFCAAHFARAVRRALFTPAINIALKYTMRVEIFQVLLQKFCFARRVCAAHGWSGGGRACLLAVENGSET